MQQWLPRWTICFHIQLTTSFINFHFLNILSKSLKSETPLLNKYNCTNFRKKNYSTDSNSSEDLVILPKFSRPGLRSIQNLPNISHHQIFFRIVIISEMLFSDLLTSHFQTLEKGHKISTHLPVDSQMVIKSSNDCRKDISQPYSDNFCWHFRWVKEKFGDIWFHS